MTYSLAITGASANSIRQVESLTISDNVALPGSMALAMQLGTQFLAKGPDGMERLYTYDAERSTPDVPILKRV